MLKKLLLLFLFSSFTLNAHALVLNFQKLTGLESHLDKEASLKHLKKHLKDYDQHRVEIRGFLYKNKLNKWILSSECDLKSCCIGRSDKVLKQIFLEGLEEIKDHSSQVVNLQGYFKIDPQWDNQGNLTQLYRIERATLLKEKEIDIVKWILIALLIFTSILLIYYVPKMKIPEKDA